LDPLETTALRPGKLDAGLLEASVIGSGPERGNRFGAETLDVSAERFERHGAHATSRLFRSGGANRRREAESGTNLLGDGIKAGRVEHGHLGERLRSSSQPIFSSPQMNWL